MMMKSVCFVQFSVCHEARLSYMISVDHMVLFFERCCIILKENKGCPLHVVNFCDPNSDRKQVINFLNEIIQLYSELLKVHNYLGVSKQ